MTRISRNPFARENLYRETVDACGSTCRWCGSVRITRSGKHKLYQYRTETDGGRKFEHSGLFCCKSCHDAYHG